MKLGKLLRATGSLARRGRQLLLVLFLLCASSAPAASMDLLGQFDVFVGYGDLGGGGIVPEASWFPVVCEIKNNGPTFTGIIEISSGAFEQGQHRRIVVELPTGTLKRVSIPVFASSHYMGNWDVRLLDERGRLRGEHSNLGTRSLLNAGATLLGALPRTSAGAPVIRQTQGSTETQPAVARFVQSAILPDNPLVWEGMAAFYLNSEKAPDLTVSQVDALQRWLNDGGHLIVAVANVSDVNATPWLRALVPFDLVGTHTIKQHPALEAWVRNYTASDMSMVGARARSALVANGSVNSYNNPFSNIQEDADFASNEMVIADGKVRNGEVLASSGSDPLMVSARQGRGRVTALLFDPERDPCHSWRNLPSFWARLAGVPAQAYAVNNSQRGGYSVDGVFGAMIDSKQIRKLPVQWLLLLLILYLVVIGPLDQYWLKRIKRPMLTWITFPCYVVCFSLMIYFIGYKLRAGETEWNELHLVDVLQRGELAELRGHTYFSIYSPVNATYRVESQQNFSAFRGEFAGSYMSGGGDAERLTVAQSGENYRADIFVPVWTSQLFASDWWETSETPVKVTLSPDSQGWTVTVYNPQDRPIEQARLAVDNFIYTLAEIPAGQSRTNHFSRGQGQSINSFVSQYSSGFQNAVLSRQHAFGASSSGQIQDIVDSSMAVSLLAMGSQYNLVLPPGIDLSSSLDRGQAVFLGWSPDASPTKPVNLFPTRRSHKNTLWRVVLNPGPRTAS